MKKIIILIGALLLILVIVTNLKNISFNPKEKAQSNALQEDTLWMNTISPDSILPDWRLDYLKQISGRLSNIKDSVIRQYYQNKIDSTLIYVKSGKRIYDEFMHDMISEQVKQVKIYFKDWSKYSVERVYKGYKNNTSRKAHNIKKKYPAWSNNVCLTIAERKISIGMTSEQVRTSWGRPQDINRTTSASGVREQWVYSNYNYVYFENGVCTTIQN